MGLFRTSYISSTRRGPPRKDIVGQGLLAFLAIWVRSLHVALSQLIGSSASIRGSNHVALNLHYDFRSVCCSAASNTPDAGGSGLHCSQHAATFDPTNIRLHSRLSRCSELALAGGRGTGTASGSKHTRTADLAAAGRNKHSSYS